jgi:Cu(I)/Ag(I) efflux system membrane fusion protein
MEIVGKKLAAAGHDTEKLKADDKAYSALPSCCKYR